MINSKWGPILGRPSSGQNFVKLFEGYQNREKSDSNNNPSDENKAKEMHLTTHYCFLLLANWVKWVQFICIYHWWPTSNSLLLLEIIETVKWNYFQFRIIKINSKYVMIIFVIWSSVVFLEHSLLFKVAHWFFEKYLMFSRCQYTNTQFLFIGSS